MSIVNDLPWLQRTDGFRQRHVAPSESEVQAMLDALGLDSLEALARAALPTSIVSERPLSLAAGLGEQQALERVHTMARENRVYRSFIGMGYHDCVTPPVILRNILEGPGWYTQYTPYQSEISQGRLEALVNFQTMVADLTGLPLANASLLDEATAAAEAMYMCRGIGRNKRRAFFVADDCHPQTIAVLETRAEPLGIELHVGTVQELAAMDKEELFGALLQYPTTDGRIADYEPIARALHEQGSLLVVAADILSLTLLRPPGEFGADIAVGSTQRFGVPMGYGGPHAAYISTHEKYKRQLPGRLVGVSRDARGHVGYRLAIQTREQHIRRDKATSNICTAQVLLAIIASMYAVHHGPEGLARIARRIRGLTQSLALGLQRMGFSVGEGPFFDTLRVRCDAARSKEIVERARARQANLRVYDDGDLGVTLDETVELEDVEMLLGIFAGEADAPPVAELVAAGDEDYPEPLRRRSAFLAHPVFNSYRAEHELLRYIHRLQAKDLSLTTSMIPLGSCTMKLNATAEMLPVTWPELARLHPFAPAEQAGGYLRLIRELESWLAEITGFEAVSLQPNAGSQGEYAGLLLIRAYHRSRDEQGRDVCLIPKSAHGTNPASAVIAGYRVVVVDCDKNGNIDVEDLKRLADKHGDELGALMITYPSTHGVFEESVKEICETVHRHGGQVYMDGANMNAQVGLCRPAEIGADVCHLNLHKTFCIPHGGGGPGVGPIAAAAHLAPFMPGHPLADCGGEQAIGPVAAAPYGSPSILPISWMYIAMMGDKGLRHATLVAILNANYMAKRLSHRYRILYKGADGFVAHEFVMDCRDFKASAGVEVEDIAKRLMDYGFHAPTMSWPVPGTLMVEPTESESKAELDRLCDALIAIHDEISAIATGELPREDNPLKNAPHDAQALAASWDHAYSREQAAFPAPWLRRHKYWPPVGRIDNTYGDRHLVCTCPAPEEFG